MIIKRIECSAAVLEKIERKHGIRWFEVEESLRSKASHLRKSADIYEFYGQSEAGRYLLVVFRNLGSGQIRIITARDMTARERRLSRQA